jgi:lysophospholipase L1-like esterase
MNLLFRKLLQFFCCAVFPLFNILNASAQQVKWDSTSRPEIYPLQVDLFRSAKHSKKDIVFLGNSITFWGDWNELLNSKHVKNRGIPGDVTYGVLDRLDEVVNGQPAKVFVLIGINDIARNIPDSVILRNYRRIIQRIKKGSPRTKIFFQTILPVNSSFNKLKAHYKTDHIKNINEGLKKLAGEEDIGLIDLYAAFADAEDKLPKELTFDGVHLTKKGYDKWVAILKEGRYIK